MARFATAIKYQGIAASHRKSHRGDRDAPSHDDVCGGTCGVRLLQPVCRASEFKVTSIKLSKSVRNGIGNGHEPQRMMWTNAPLKVLNEESFADLRISSRQTLAEAQ